MERKENEVEAREYSKGGREKRKEYGWDAGRYG